MLGRGVGWILIVFIRLYIVVKINKIEIIICDFDC